MKLIISTHFFFLSKIVKAFLLIKCHAKGFARERGRDSHGSGGSLSKTTSLTYQGSINPNAMENISTEFCINKNNIFKFTYYKQYTT